VRLNRPAFSLIRTALAVIGFVSEAIRKSESPDAATPGATCPRPRSRTTWPYRLTDNEHAALAGIDMASNDAERADFRSTAGGGTTGVVGPSSPHAQTAIARQTMLRAFIGLHLPASP
jgi:hypothetical protein